ncbi:protocadherin-11 X-linked-like isoform X2 [Physella acuta]|uniref:protocadherin-11 X-linked-like isoform X2 n=1 Tax=Physella acuta TaxID=109671 RepID=UPI0027DB7DF4|nr:protocadherin-11 X-linked-like isoform X2 [Physella acuta]
MPSVRSVRPWVYLITLLSLSASSLSQPTVTFDFREEQSENTVIGNVAQVSGLAANVTQDVFNGLSFDLDTSEYFKIQQRTGSLSTIKRIDREQIQSCKDAEVCLLKTSVTVLKNGGTEFYMFINVNVRIIDINDNAPSFGSDVVSLSVPENNNIEDELRTGAAVDPDYGSNSVERYTFTDTSETFRVDLRTSPDGSKYLAIVMRKVLDREVRDFYQITIVATDGGYPIRSGSALINITVLDVNDNDPEFLQMSYNESVKENTKANVSIMRVQARDPDAGSNGEVSYQFSSRVSDKIRETFFIDSKTGEILAKGPIDYEQDKQFQITVEAVDNGIPQRSARTSVSLYVLDENDNAPNINISPSGTDILESDPIDSFISYISVTDADSGPNGMFSCEINDDHFTLVPFLSTDSGTYKVILAKPLDHEKDSSVKVIITCKDNGSPSRSSSSAFIVNVGDVNDNYPVFTQDTYTGSVMENLIGMHSVVTVSAHDADSGNNGRITYSLQDKFNGLFNVDPYSGEITVRRMLDREAMARYEFHVFARDNGIGGLSTSCLVIVDVGDENDEPPRFPYPVYFGHVLENQPKGVVVGNVTALDRDTPANSNAVYSILESGSDYRFFTIDPKNGVVKSNAVFDREVRDRYQMVISVRDPDMPSFISTCNFTVNVLDDNDNDPVIHLTTEDNATIVVQYSVPVGSVITTISATDSDDPSSTNSQINYIITRGDPDQLFNLNRFTGSLTLARIVTTKDLKAHYLVIKAQDGGDPPRFDTMEIIIKINGTIPPVDEAGLSSNILIVIILIGVTVVLGLAILTTICLIRKIDRERRLNSARQKNSEQLYHQKQPDVFKNIAVNGVEESNSNDLSKRGRKEVSFSLDDESDSHNTSTGSAHPLTSFKGGTDRTQANSPNKLTMAATKNGNGTLNIPVNAEKQTNIRRSPQEEEVHLMEMLKKSAAEDALSESSGGSDPSDSGRGGSEDDSSHRGSGLDPEARPAPPSKFRGVSRM